MLSFKMSSLTRSLRRCARIRSNVSQAWQARSLASSSTDRITTIRQCYDDSRHAEFSLECPSTKSPQPLIKQHSQHTPEQVLRDLAWYFLPRGYPDSVVSGYDRFAVGQMVAITMGTTCGVLSMQSMLFAIGAGSGALPLAATLNWIIKDGLGQFGGILFASLVNNRFDADPKRWRMIASVSMDAASLLELLTPLCPAYFLPMAAVANVGKNISYLSASASRAAIHKSFCLHENLADVTVKSGSQSIIGSLVGTGLGLVIAASVGQQYEAVLAAFISCSALSIGATYASLQYVTITTVSLDRLDVLLADYLNRHPPATTAPTASAVSTSTNTDTDTDTNSNPSDVSANANTPLLSPAELRDMEYYLGTAPSSLPLLVVGADLSEAVADVGQLRHLLDIFEEEEYILNCCTGKSVSRGNTSARGSSSSGSSGSSGSGSDNGSGSTPVVHLLYKEHASVEGMLSGLAHAHVLRTSLLHTVGSRECPCPLPSQARGSSDQQWDGYGSGDMQLVRRSLNEVRSTHIVRDFVQTLLEQKVGGGRVAAASMSSINTSNGSTSSSVDSSATETWLVDPLMLEPRRARIAGRL